MIPKTEFLIKRKIETTFEHSPWKNNVLEYETNWNFETIEASLVFTLNEEKNGKATFGHSEEGHPKLITVLVDGEKTVKSSNVYLKK